MSDHIRAAFVLGFCALVFFGGAWLESWINRRLDVRRSRGGTQ